MHTQPITPQASLSDDEQQPFAQMLLADAALRHIAKSVHDAPAAADESSPSYSADAEVPDLSDATSEEDRKGAAAVASASLAEEDMAATGTSTPQLADASEGPSTGPSTPAGNWLEPRDLTSDRWVSEAAAFGTPGAWGDMVSPEEPAASDAAPPPSPTVVSVPDTSGRQHPFGKTGADGKSPRPGAMAASSLRSLPALEAIPPPAPAAAAASSAQEGAPPVRVRLMAPAALGEAAARALALPGRPGARPAQQEEQGLRRASLTAAGLSAANSLPQAAERRLPLPDSGPASSAEADDFPAPHQLPQVEGRRGLEIDSDGDHDMVTPPEPDYDPLEADVLSDGGVRLGRGAFAGGNFTDPDDSDAGDDEDDMVDGWRRRSTGDESLDEDLEAAGLPSDSDDDGPLPAVYCRNCTARLIMGTTCLECGHDLSDDATLFAVDPIAAAAVASAQAERSANGPECTVLAWDERMALHAEGRSNPHPERPDRLRAVMARLLNTGLAARCKLLPARTATRTEIEACHSEQLVDLVELASLEAAGTRYFTPDTYANEHTATCASLAAAACADVATAVVMGRARSGAAIVRPPGHHAESAMSMGFCFYNNAGIAARAAQAAGARRVLILDWDVHHGNGIQHIFEEDDSVLYMSLHRHDYGHFYPGTGAIDEVGYADGQGFTVNVPWPQGGMANGDYIAAFNHVLVPIAYEYAPDLIIVSAGFDAAEGDPIGGCNVTPGCFAHLTALLQPVAPLAVLLEGGYNLDVTARSVAACMRVLLGERPPPLSSPAAIPSAVGLNTIREVIAVQAKYWKCLRGLTVAPVAAQLSGHLLFNSLPGLAANGSTPASHAHAGPDRQDDEESALISPRSAAAAHSLERSLRRNKLARAQCGKSSRRWHMLQSLHMAVVKSFLKKQRRQRLRGNSALAAALDGAAKAAIADVAPTAAAYNADDANDEH